MLTSLVMEAVMLLKTILALLHKYYTAIVAKLDVIDAELDDLASIQQTQSQTLIDIQLVLETLRSQMNDLLTAIIPSLAVGIRMVIIVDGKIHQEGLLPMATTITATQKSLASVSFVDGKNNPALVEGVPTFTVSDPALLSIVPTADPNIVEVLAVGPVGQAQLKVEADADLGAGVVPVIGIVDITIIAGQAVGVTINMGAPVEQ